MRLPFFFSVVLVGCVLVCNVTAFLSTSSSSFSSLENSRIAVSSDRSIATHSIGYVNASCRNFGLYAAADGDSSDAVKGVKQVTGEELEKELQSWDTPVVLDVYAPWCGPCQLLAPELEHVAKLYKDKLRILKLDSDEEPQVASMLKVYGLPTVLFMKEGKVVYRAEGALPAAEVSRLINLHIFGNGEEEKKE